MRGDDRSRSPHANAIVGCRAEWKFVLQESDHLSHAYRSRRRARSRSLHDNDAVRRFDSRGRDVVENQPVEKLEFNDSENRTLTVWIHSTTLLPVKQSFKRWDPTINDRRDEVTRYTKYRESGNGVMWPWDTQKERDGEKLFELYSDKVKIGDDLPDSLFELPSGITVLKK